MPVGADQIPRIERHAGYCHRQYRRIKHCHYPAHRGTDQSGLADPPVGRDTAQRHGCHGRGGLPLVPIFVMGEIRTAFR